MELSPNEEPVWTYFDAQHKYILDQMKETYNAAVAVIRGAPMSYPLCISSSLTHYPLVVHEKATEETSPKDVLTQALASQLRTCLHALESKQAETVIGVSLSSTKENILWLKIDSPSRWSRCLASDIEHG